MTVVVFDGAWIVSDGLIVEGANRLLFDNRPKFGAGDPNGRGLAWAAAGDSYACAAWSSYVRGERQREPRSETNGSFVHYVDGRWYERQHNSKSRYELPARWQIGCGSREALAVLALGGSALAAAYAAARVNTGCDFPLYRAQLADLIAYGDTAIEVLTREQSVQLINGCEIAAI